MTQDENKDLDHKQEEEQEPLSESVDVPCNDFEGSPKTRRFFRSDTFWGWFRNTARLWGFLAFILLIVILFRQVILPFLLALLVTYVLTPVLNYLTKVEIGSRKLPRFIWLIALYVVLLGMIALFITLFVPRVTQDFKRVVAEAPQLAKKVKEQWVPAVETWVEENFHEKMMVQEKFAPSPNKKPKLKFNPQSDGSYEISMEDLRFEFKQKGEKRFEVSIVDPRKEDIPKSEVRRFLSGLISGGEFKMKQVVTAGQRVVGGLMKIVTTFILVLMISAFLLLDSEKILRWTTTLVPIVYRPDYENVLTQIDKALGGAIRGQLLICLVNGVMTGVGLVLIGVKYAFLLSLLAGVMSLIPIFGSILSSIPIVIVALVSGNEGVDVLKGTIVLAWIIGIHLIEANLLNPKIIGSAAKIHPVIVIFAVVAGERSYGAVGALLAVPIVSAVQATFVYIRQKVVLKR